MGCLDENAYANSSINVLISEGYSTSLKNLPNNSGLDFASVGDFNLIRRKIIESVI